MSEGIPTYENDDNKGIKMEDITSQRATLEKELGFNNKPKSNNLE